MTAETICKFLCGRWREKGSHACIRSGESRSYCDDVRRTLDRRPQILTGSSTSLVLAAINKRYDVGYLHRRLPRSVTVAASYAIRQ